MTSHFLFAMLSPLLLGAEPPSSPGPIPAERALELLNRLLSRDEAARATARAGLLGSGDRSLLPALVDALFMAPAEARDDVVGALEGLSGEKLGTHYRYWFEYIGGREDIRPAPWYRQWKAGLFARIDPAFARFLDPSQPMTIRAEEILWGGVKKDGIPALTSPRSVSSSEATFLTGGEIVFGVGLGGQFRAYPQRILDWHEMANDVLGGEPFTLSYCTLCGAAVAYGTRPASGRAYVFGSSGLLYRSNKLMYDEGTLSLWSNLTGEPVAGPLAGRGISLPLLPVTVTTWADWRVRHPETTVAGLATGFRRDYSAGAAYGKYFASPETMFPVWKRDTALPPKAWVYAMRRGAAARAYPLDLLFAERVVNDTLAGEAVVLVAEPETQAVRAYARRGHWFAEGAGPARLVEPATGALWSVAEDRLVPAEGADDGQALLRLPGHRAYWFGWYAFFPDTALYGGCLEGLRPAP